LQAKIWIYIVVVAFKFSKMSLFVKIMNLPSALENELNLVKFGFFG